MVLFPLDSTGGLAWPDDFKVSTSLEPGYECKKICKSGTDYIASATFYVCYKSGKTNPNITIDASHVKDKQCTRALEPGDWLGGCGNMRAPYICAPDDSPYHFEFRWAQMVRGKWCMGFGNLKMPQALRTIWHDNYLCAYKTSGVRNTGRLFSTAVLFILQ